MTRDDAIEKYRDCMNDNGCSASSGYAAAVVDFLAWTGTLQLEELKTASEQFEEIALAHMDSAIFVDFRDELDRAGLQIVEKSK